MLDVRYHHNTTGKQLQMRYDTIRYLACSKKLTGSQLSPHESNTQCKRKKTKNKLMSMIRPVQSQSQCVRNLGRCRVPMMRTHVQRNVHLVHREGDWAPPHCTKCNSPPINGQCILTSYYSMWHYNCQSLKG